MNSGGTSTVIQFIFSISRLYSKLLFLIVPGGNWRLHHFLSTTERKKGLDLNKVLFSISKQTSVFMRF